MLQMDKVVEEKIEALSEELKAMAAPITDMIQGYVGKIGGLSDYLEDLSNELSNIEIHLNDTCREIPKILKEKVVNDFFSTDAGEFMTQEEILSKFEKVEDLKDNNFSAVCPNPNCQEHRLYLSIYNDGINIHCTNRCNTYYILQSIDLDRWKTIVRNI